MTALQETHRPQSHEDQQQRKQQVLTHGTASAVHSIADALVIKDRDLFFLCKPDGDTPIDGDHGFGLYYDDCRFLRGYEMRLASDLADRLASSAGAGNAMDIALTNPELQTSAKEKVPKERVGVTWHREIDSDGPALRDTIALENFGIESARFPLTLRFDACFEDVFDVRGLIEDHPGKLHDPRWHGDDLLFEYEGADRRDRRLLVSFDPAPQQRQGTEVHWDVALDPQQRREFKVELRIEVRGGGPTGHGDENADTRTQQRGERAGANRRRQGKPATGETFTGVRSDSKLLDGIVDRSLKDLRMLRSDNAGAEYYAAGVPWFVALFGRDSAITSIQTLAYDPSVAEQTLRVLAAWQGTHADDYRDEEPGKILHELRVGELASIGAVPHHPFYGSVDSTPLFCLLMALHSRWTGKLDLFNELREHVDAALEWIDRYGDTDGDGFIDYRSPEPSATRKGLVNQGWKDSGNGIVNEDGSLVTPPVALVEVQGYVFAAKRELADLYERAGDGDRAAALRKQAAVISSNPGQALWTGIVSADRADAVCKSLMDDKMFSGWGIRTLSTDAVRFNPIGYHLGTVWPHDNSIIAAGFRRYGFDEAAHKVASGIVDAAAVFPEYRLPEVFAGYRRSRFSMPVHYPVACHPQAWAAGSVPFLLTTLLGMEPDAIERRLRISKPSLLPFVDWLELRGVRVAEATCDLRFERDRSGVAVHVLGVQGDLHVDTSGADGTGRQEHEGQPVAAGRSGDGRNGS